ncbi:MAG: zinc dependent phospholipase C family protein [Ruminococcus sp.]|nr:zinc dependent phospholipase C family protein [Ruminococcus sp.]
MKTRDHKKLAGFWACRLDAYLPHAYALAFFYGNLEPDMNIFTHFHGFTKKHKLHGHRFVIIYPILLRMLQRDVGKPLTLLRCYRIGKCCHYTTDIFTFAHNPEFTGQFSEHNRYESMLHAYF